MPRPTDTFLQHPTSLFLAGLLVLLLVNAQHLFDPPYWDSIVGLFNQAIWLKDNNFDFWGLARQPDYMAGGARVKLNSGVAPLVGLFYHLFSPLPVFAALRIVNVACAALTLTLFFLMMRSFLPLSCALVWCLAGISNPIFSSQTAAIYVEVPVAACTTAVIYAIFRERYGLATTGILLAYFVKNSVLLLALAVFVWVIVHSILCRRRTPAVTPSHTIFWLLLPMPLLFSVDVIVLPGTYQEMLWPTIHRIVTISNIYFPDQIVVLALVLVSAVLLLRRGHVGRWWADPRSSVIILLFLFVGGFWSSFWFYHSPLCRYTVSQIFPLCLLASFFLCSALGRRAALGAGILLLAWNGIGQWGALLPPLPTQYSRSGDALERSREYLIDLESNQELCRLLENSYSQRPVVAKFPFVQMLTIPELGYVKKPLPFVYAADLVPGYTLVRQLDLETWSSSDTLFVFSPTVFDQWPPSLVPREGAEVVFLDQELPGPLLVYSRPNPMEGSR